ncbi:hypothetical protein [Streptomyces sp. B6B3]|uniref:hypothetical protein n=1 Tax=Streptomyces sp. B6B3 TaxID=3153570 RepID=UPI00325E436C
MDQESIADELYGLRPTEFTAARDGRARAARKEGDRELANQVSRLRRPTLAAWASNLLVRAEPDAAERLTQLGRELRRAMRELDGAQLRELLGRQRRLVAALAGQAARLADEAGHPIGEEAQREVERTLLAVLADEEASDRWAAGRLDRPLSPPSDLGGVGLGDAPDRAAGPRGPARERTRDRARAEVEDRGRAGRRADVGDLDQARRRRAERARRELERARRAADEAGSELRGREERQADAERRHEEAERGLAEARQRVTEARELLKRAEHERDAADADRHRSAKRLREAERAVDQARRRAQDATATVRRREKEAERFGS